MQVKRLIHWFPLLAALASCSAENRVDERQQQSNLAALEALPYVDWSPDTKNSRSGVTLIKQDSVTPGFNLYSNTDNEAYLVDMEGQRVHTWRLPESAKRCRHVEMIANGSLLAVCLGSKLFKISWNSELELEVPIPVHHDVEVLTDGGFVLPIKTSEEIYRGRRVRFDGLVWVDAGGSVVDRWSTYDHLAELRRHHPPSALDEPNPGKLVKKKFDYYHLNSVEALPETDLGLIDDRFRPGNLLICLRNVSTIFVLDRDTHEVTWSWGSDELEDPHMPSMLPNGRILVFDNGPRRGYSRVVEVDPETSRIAWQYQAEPRESFFSARRGSAQRLPNGNTLICESEKGHVFEVTPGGEIVWEFWNPDRAEDRRRQIYRFERLSESRVQELMSP